MGLQAQTLALTLDDGPAMGSTPRMEAKARNEAILAAFSKHKVKTALFVNGINGGDSPEGKAILTRWGTEGHWVGNHTYSHRNIQKTTLDDFEKDVLRGDELIAGIPGYARFLRFPYLKEGDTRKKRDGMRAFLKQRGYRNAPVTITTFDWLLDDHLCAALKRDPGTNLEPYRAYYLQHFQNAIKQHQAVAKVVTGREIKHVVLMHDNLLNALFMEDLLTILEKNGCRIVSPAEAYDDPIYAQEPESIATGESLLWGLARDRKMTGGLLEDLNAFFIREEAMLQESGL